MKKLILALTFFTSFSFSSQIKSEEIHKAKFLAFTPIGEKTEIVNGLAIGFDLADNFDLQNNNTVKVNGVNIGLNPLGMIIWFFYDPDKNPNTGADIIQNGVNISLGGFFNNTNHSGLNVSLYNYGNKMTGLSVVGLTTAVEEMRGVHVSGLANVNEKGAGLSLSMQNYSNAFLGAQVGIYNNSKKMSGVQIGLINTSKELKGFQIGFWNKNGKRTLPFFNWNFNRK